MENAWIHFVSSFFPLPEDCAEQQSCRHYRQTGLWDNINFIHYFGSAGPCRRLSWLTGSLPWKLGSGVHAAWKSMESSKVIFILHMPGPLISRLMISIVFCWDRSVHRLFPKEAAYSISFSVFPNNYASARLNAVICFFLSLQDSTRLL